MKNSNFTDPIPKTKSYENTPIFQERSSYLQHFLLKFSTVKPCIGDQNGFGCNGGHSMVLYIQMTSSCTLHRTSKWKHYYTDYMERERGIHFVNYIPKQHRRKEYYLRIISS